DAYKAELIKPNIKTVTNIFVNRCIVFSVKGFAHFNLVLEKAESLSHFDYLREIPTNHFCCKDQPFSTSQSGKIF
ncbi:MAG: hypothetical protein NZ852_00885, partial [SAR324 cluster bacterium]|nr:hypothetical protein [SAR324 cluster bacterium]